jgi:hypothetical protein
VLLRDARKNLRGVQRTLIKDFDEMQKAAAGKRRPRSKPAKRTPAAGPSAKRAPAKRTAAAKTQRCQVAAQAGRSGDARGAQVLAVRRVPS